MQANYAAILKKVLVFEGGYVNHPKDPGGRTLQGVTQAVYDAYRARRGKPRQLLTAGMMGTPAWEFEMAEIYETGYWRPIHGNALRDGIDSVLFDYAVNSGPARAARVAQRLAGRPVTGKLSAEDVTAINKRNPEQFVNAVCDERLAFLRSLKTWDTFGRGWTSRVASVRTFSLDLARRKIPAPAAPVATPGKGQVPSTASQKGGVLAGGGAAGGGIMATAGEWIAAHPGVIIGLCVIAIIGVTFIFYKLDQQRERQQNTPMPVPELPEFVLNTEPRT